MVSLPAPVGGLRFLRIMVILLAIGTILNTGVSVGAIVLTQRHNGDRIADIQRERVAATIRSCQEINARHDDAFRVTAKLLKRPAAPSQRRLTPAQKKAQRDATEEWLSSIVPKRDCRALAARTVPSKP